MKNYDRKALELLMLKIELDMKKHEETLVEYFYNITICLNKLKERIKKIEKEINNHE